MEIIIPPPPNNREELECIGYLRRYRLEIYIISIIAILGITYY